LPAVKIQNGGCIQNGVEISYIFHQIFLFTTGKNKALMEKNFLENSKWRKKLMRKIIFF
jgi:hypothetical protein